MTKIIFLLAAGLLTLTTLAPAFASHPKVWVCHYNEGHGGTYELIEVSMTSAHVTDGGHLDRDENEDFIIGHFDSLDDLNADEGPNFQCEDWL